MQKRLPRLIDRHLGRCPHCMRNSFLAAFLALVTTAAEWVGGSPMAAFLAPCAAALLLLWLSHLAAYSWRTSRLRRDAEPAGGDTDLARRAFFPAFASIFAGAAIATALPLSSARALGGECPATSGRHCPDNAPYCCYSPSRRLYYCRIDINHCDLQ